MVQWGEERRKATAGLGEKRAAENPDIYQDWCLCRSQWAKKIPAINRDFKQFMKINPALLSFLLITIRLSSAAIQALRVSDYLIVI